ncbi:MAG: FAD binding domain-containing protein [Acidothermales bacterium]|nr:FAD binding domain-containing protein [Acidothermales bacterium]
MYPRAVAYTRARSVPEALETLATYGPDACPLAGGMSLVPWLKYRQRSPGLLVDVGRLAELAGIEPGDGPLRIGATTRHADVAVWRDAVALALLPELAAGIGDVQVRGMGTVGGGLAAVEPTGDWGGALLAMRGSVVARSVSGERRIASDDFFLDTYRSSLRPDELLTEVLLPVPSERFGTAAVKLDKRAAAAPLMSCAVRIDLDATGSVREAGVGCVGLAGYPVRLGEVEAALRGASCTPEAIGDAAACARDAADDAFAGSVLTKLVRDALGRASERAQRLEAVA